MFRVSQSGCVRNSLVSECLLSAVLLAFFAGAMMTTPACAQEIPLQNCGGLLTIQVDAGERSFTFLVDTAANSTFLNVKSFPYGISRPAAIANWRGTDSVIGHEVFLDELVIGNHRLKDLRLSAIDLSSMQRACGKRIDGVLGANLLEKLGMNIDLKNRVARFGPAASAREEEQAQFDELDRQVGLCGAAFSRADERTFQGCLDPDVVLYTLAGAYRGREEVMKYFADTYFHRDRSAVLTLTPRAHHLTGNIIWLEYELRIVFPDQAVHARGTAHFRNENGSWLLLDMNQSVAYDE